MKIEEMATQFPQFVLLHSVTCVQLRLITILGNCGCQFLWCALALTNQNLIQEEIKRRLNSGPLSPETFVFLSAV
jgi:hypothetical protein